MLDEHVREKEGSAQTLTDLQVVVTVHTKTPAWFGRRVEAKSELAYFLKIFPTFEIMLGQILQGQELLGCLTCPRVLQNGRLMGMGVKAANASLSILTALKKRK